MSSPLIQNIFPAPPLLRGEITRGYLSGVKQLHLEPPAPHLLQRSPPFSRSSSLPPSHQSPPLCCRAPARPPLLLQTSVCKFGRFSLSCRGEEREVPVAPPIADFPSALNCMKRLVEEKKEDKTYLDENGSPDWETLTPSIAETTLHSGFFLSVQPHFSYFRERGVFPHTDSFYIVQPNEYIESIPKKGSYNDAGKTIPE